ncbi:hypothetical protein DTO166G5_541 [Paecilomyces variotii]|nr:hypothetical protein DTO166G5_541 [Paecilomyces variotii]
MSTRSPLAGDEIRTIHSMTHMIYHRNKNQHSSAKWWKWLRILKSSIYSLLMALEDDMTGKTVATYEDHLRRRLIPRCYLAFSAVVADTQFSALGTVLLAIVARVAGVVGIQEENLQESPVAYDEVDKPSYGTALGQPQDIGEPVHRATNAPALTRQQADDELTAARVRRPKSKSASDDQTSAPNPSKSKRHEPSTRKKRKKNAIDDLFSNLL